MFSFWVNVVTQSVLKHSGAGTSSRQRKDVVALLGPEFPMAAGRNDHVVFAVEHVGHRSCLAAGGKLVLPKLFAGFDIEGAKIIIHGSGGEDQAVCANHCAGDIAVTSIPRPAICRL